MSKRDSKQPLNITINGNEVDEDKKQDVYENYIIQANKRLQKENEKLKDENKELSSTNDDLEEEQDKEERSKTYMKGLMHNLYDMKKKAFEMSNLRKQIYDDHNKQTKELIKKPLKIYIIPNTALRLNIREYYIFSFLVMPFLAFITSIINVRIFIVLFFLSIYPGTILYFFVKDEVQTNQTRYDEFIKSHNSTINKIKELRKEINETENSCRCLDAYIDEL